MKIKSPCVNKNEVEPLCRAGADELFCGMEPYSWSRQFKDLCMNQRSANASFSKLADLEEAINIAHKYKAKVHVAINAFFYLKEQYQIVQKIIKDVLGAGADGVILVDPWLLSNMDKRTLRDKDVVMGCDAVIFNSASVEFYKNLGATRIVLPRSMTIKEISEVVKLNSAIEYEVFIINDLCYFEDGLCTYCKEQSDTVTQEGKGIKKYNFFSCVRTSNRGSRGGCRTEFSRERLSLMQNRKLKVNRRFSFWDKKHIEGCGACALYDFKIIGITSLKVLDRNLPAEEKIKATAFIKKSQEFLDNDDISRLDYEEKCRVLFKQVFKTRCNQYDCYYPLWKKLYT